MSYAASEASQAGGAPVECYRFERRSIATAAGAIDTVLVSDALSFAEDAGTEGNLPTVGAWQASKTYETYGCHRAMFLSGPAGLGILLPGTTVAEDDTVCTGTIAWFGHVAYVTTISGLTPFQRLTAKVFANMPAGTTVVMKFNGQYDSGNRVNNGGTRDLVYTGTVQADGTVDILMGFTYQPSGGAYSLGRLVTFSDFRLGYSTAVPAQLGTIETALYTSADVPFTINGDTYRPGVLSRGGYDIGGQEASDANLEIRLPVAHEVAQWVVSQDQRPITVTVTRFHRADYAVDPQGFASVTPVRAQVIGSRIEGRACVLTCAPVGIRLLARQTPRQRYSKGCNHVLYGADCGVSKVAFTLTAVEVTAVSTDGLTVTVAGVDDYAVARAVAGCFVRGILASAAGPARTIVDQVGDVLTLLTPMPGLTVGTLVDVTEGCAHSTDACARQFDNLARFGGFPGIPTRNPFDPSDRGLA